MEHLEINEDILARVSLPFVEHFNKGMALEIFKIYKKHNLNVSRLVQWIAGISAIPHENINAKALVSSLHKLKKKHDTLRRDARAALCQDIFCPPTLLTKAPAVDFEEQTYKHVAESLGHELYAMRKELSDTNEEHKNKMTILQQQLYRKEEKLKEKRIKIKEVQDKCVGFERKFKRRETAVQKSKCRKSDKQCETTKRKGKSQAAHISTFHGSVKILHRQLAASRARRNHLQKENVELKRKLQEAQINSAALDVLHDEKIQLLKELEGAKKENEDLRVNESYLLNLLSDNAPLKLFDDVENKFSSETVESVMKLLDCGVATASVGPVIKAVASLCGRSPDRLPSRQLVDDINIRRLAVVQNQLAELASEKNMTLYTDETSKYGSKYMVYATTTSDQKTRVLGMKQIPSKSAADTLDTLVGTLDEISETCGMPDLGKELIVNLKNTMSDRAATEKLFNSMLQKYREKLMPSIISGFENFTEEQKESTFKMNHFFCGLHLLVSLAENFSSSIRQLEASLVPEDIGAATHQQTKWFTKKSESPIIRCVRTACKLFARGADEKNGCFAEFSSYLEDHNKKNILTAFKHNRFNVLFYDGGAVFYLRNEIQEFIDKVHGMPNTLVSAVYFDLKEPWCVAGAKALGLISKLLTAPLWRLLEDPKVHIAEMSQVFTELVMFLQDYSSDDRVASFMNGTCVPALLEPLVVKDQILECLTTPDETDGSVAKILTFLFSEWAILLKRLVNDHLPGGKLHDYEESGSLGVTREETKSVTKHNKLCEELFAHLDRLRMVRPNATTLTNEAHILFTKNKTTAWLDNKSSADKKAILDASVRRVSSLRRNMHKKLGEISERRKDFLKEKEERLSKLKRKQFEKNEELTSKIIYYGLWQSGEEIDQKLSTIRTQKEKLEVLKGQINFRKTVLVQPVEVKTLYQFSSKECGTFSVSQLTENLKILVESAHQVNRESCDNVDRYSHMLVGKRVQHKFDVGHGESTWYSGDVISQVPGFPQWFNITYDEDPAVYSFQLLIDMEKGDLKLEVPSIED